MKERLQNLLLTGLLLLMAALMAATFLVAVRNSQGGRRLLHLEEEPDQTEQTASADLPACPEVLALAGEEGLYVPTEGEEIAQLCRQAEPLLQEALGSAGQPQPLGEEDYLALLSAPAILVQYHAPQPLYLLQAWGGSENLREGMEVTGAALARQEGAVVLLLTDREGRRWRAETAASAADLAALCQELPESNAVFAQPSDSLPGDQVLITRTLQPAGMTASAPELARRGELSQGVQSLLDMNAYLARVYPNPDGSLVYVEGRSTVRLSPNGDLVYTSTEGADLKPVSQEGAPRQAELCRKVFDLMTELWERAGASGRLSLEELRAEEGQRLVLRFGLWEGGAFLERTEGDWATVVVEDGVIMSVAAALRQLDGGENVSLLPMELFQAALPEGRAALRVRLLERTGTFVPRLCRVTED